MRKSTIFLWGVLCLLTTFTPRITSATTANFYVKENYINRYQTIAVEEMNRSGIPASITLAQGIIESMWGQGTLAINSNNHFGIKCKEEWIGGRYEHFDDDYDRQGRKIKSCFRVYNSPYDSYRDHTDFLTQRGRYSLLFNFAVTDYVNWARGLKSCGYATDPAYADKLIRIIEENQLQRFDTYTTQQIPLGNPVIEQNAEEFYATTTIELPAVQINVQLENDSDFQPYEVIYQNELETQTAENWTTPSYGEREVKVTVIPTTVSYEDIFVPQPILESAYDEELAEDMFVNYEPVATVEIPKPVIHYARSMNYFPDHEVVMKAPSFSYATTTNKPQQPWQRPVLSEPVFEVQGAKPTIHFSDQNYDSRLQQAEREVKWGNTQIR
ncbi:MAG: glycoside hydrolase family 73 protein [Saprospiraceae bacterium]